VSHWRLPVTFVPYLLSDLTSLVRANRANNGTLFYWLQGLPEHIQTSALTSPVLHPDQYSSELNHSITDIVHMEFDSCERNMLMRIHGYPPTFRQPVHCPTKHKECPSENSVRSQIHSRENSQVTPRSISEVSISLFFAAKEMAFSGQSWLHPVTVLYQGQIISYHYVSENPLAQKQEGKLYSQLINCSRSPAGPAIMTEGSGIRWKLSHISVSSLSHETIGQNSRFGPALPVGVVFISLDANWMLRFPSAYP
jgi:hypothetical protein